MLLLTRSVRRSGYFTSFFKVSACPKRNMAYSLEEKGSLYSTDYRLYMSEFTTLADCCRVSNLSL